MTRYTIKWPREFEDSAWEIEAKGWFSEIEVSIGGRTLRPVFYDPIRLAQEVSDEVSRVGMFFEKNLIVVPIVTRRSIEMAIASLAETGELQRLDEGNHSN